MKKIIPMLLVVAVLISSCIDILDVPINTPQDNVEYKIIRIEGMPCLLVESPTYSGHTVRSVDCDWSKWDGKVEP